MHRLQQLQLVQFKNHSFQKISFLGNAVGICGNNGTGKTNLLDAIYYLCFTKSYFTNTDALLVQHQTAGFRVEGVFETAYDGQQQIVAILRETGKKEVSCNGEQYKKLAAHIGKFPAVMVAPDDIALINEGSEVRRKWLDVAIAQVDATYLQQLSQYNKVLLQRNSFLKLLREYPQQNQQVLHILTQQLTDAGTAIFEKRTQFMAQLEPICLDLYQRFGGNAAEFSIQYQSALQEQPFPQLLEQNLQRDIFAERTTQGIHKDDLLLHINQLPAKNHASQGQKKTILFALKMTEFTLLKQQLGITPLLLLDDVFEKLDEQRLQNFVAWLQQQQPVQVFITDTHAERLQAVLQQIDAQYQLIETK